MSSFLSFSPDTLSVKDLHQHLLGAINPRPIAFVATENAEGLTNLAPFSFFNVFGANPPIVIFSPARRGRDNTTKNTYENIKLNDECTINIVSYKMTYQMVLASTEYPEEVDEFEKAGFTKLKSNRVRPPRVAESPFQMECKVREILNYGELPGGGNMIVAEVLQIHIDKTVLDEQGSIDPYKIDTIGRCGKMYYTRTKEGLYTVENPKGTSNIGFDGLPKEILESNFLTGNDLARLAMENSLPSLAEIEVFKKENPALSALEETDKHVIARDLISDGNVAKAWLLLLS